MDILVAKLLGLLGLFGLMLAGVLVPVRLLLVDYDKAHRYRRALSVSDVFQRLQIGSDYPLAETMMMLGFFLTVFVEQAVLTFRKEKPSFIDLETFNAGGSEAGSDSDPAELAGAGPLRLASLVLALSAHSVFEGLALGLQEDGAKLGSLFLGVAVHQTLAAVALGVSVAKASLGMRDSAKGGHGQPDDPSGDGRGDGHRVGADGGRRGVGGAAGTRRRHLPVRHLLEILSRELDDKRDRAAQSPLPHPRLRHARRTRLHQVVTNRKCSDARRCQRTTLNSTTSSCDAEHLDELLQRFSQKKKNTNQDWVQMPQQRRMRFVEQAVLTFRKEKPSFIDLETFNAGGSEAGSDSEYDTPFISSARGSPGGARGSHGHQHGHFSPAELAGAGPLRLASLVLALSAHSVFEGLALGLQEDGAKLGSLFLGVAVHQTLAAVALG
ncbi:Zinc transporter ZIP3 [Collichthys lucidus]|uniref:Zinc transporter ZIP3 n=1 Tax=Collichthys lucidus TaxID=240159 RepID=A0A4U5UKM6_COLLU|nr:Zinc transporter ZIP3 [Collichthys lucidus]